MPVSELSADARGSFLVRTYSHLALAIVLFVGLEVWFFNSSIAGAIVGVFSSVSWLLVLGGFLLSAHIPHLGRASWVCDRGVRDPLSL